MMNDARKLMRQYRSHWDRFPVLRPIYFNERQYQPGESFVRAESGATEHQVQMLYRQRVIGTPLAAPPRAEDGPLFPPTKPAAPVRPAQRGR